MKTAVYSICYNEEYMLPFFLQHYSFADIIIYDNESTDNSVELMKKANAEVRTYGNTTDSRELIYLDIKNHSWKECRNKYDFVIICDIDELVYPIEFNNKYTVYQCCGYQMLCDELPTYDRPIYEQVNMGARDLRYDKMCIFNPNKIEEINYEIGCHAANPIGEINLSNDIKLLHYNYLTLEYHLKRYENCAKRVTEVDKQMGNDYQYFQSKEIRTEKYNELKNRLERVV